MASVSSTVDAKSRTTPGAGAPVKHRPRGAGPLMRSSFGGLGISRRQQVRDRTATGTEARRQTRGALPYEGARIQLRPAIQRLTGGRPPKARRKCELRCRFASGKSSGLDDLLSGAGTPPSEPVTDLPPLRQAPGAPAVRPPLFRANGATREPSKLSLTRSPRASCSSRTRRRGLPRHPARRRQGGCANSFARPLGRKTNKILPGRRDVRPRPKLRTGRGAAPARGSQASPDGGARGSA